MKYAVVFSSKTGNTKRLAEAIRAALGEAECIYFGPPDPKALEAPRLYVGFWTDKGTCDMSVVDFLSELHGKKVALFGTCGMGKDSEYMERIGKHVKVWIPEDCTYLGFYMCQGKMPMDVRRRYETMEKNGVEPEKVKMLLANFDEALLHPDDRDVQNAAAFAKRMMEKAESC